MGLASHLLKNTSQATDTVLILSEKENFLVSDKELCLIVPAIGVSQRYSILFYVVPVPVPVDPVYQVIMLQVVLIFMSSLLN
jgi:hypothetical protein